jgi:uncharacterized small protein (DUF1192 family)
MARSDDDDERPMARKKLFEPPLLETLSIAELEGYISDLKEEISRVEQAIAAKRNVRAGADSLFNKKKN